MNSLPGSAGGGLRPHPVDVPHRLVAAFESLGARPVLVGGTAVQAWTGLSEGVFQTFDLDFVTTLRRQDFERLGMPLEVSGRHMVVDGRPVEYPSGPLAVGDLVLDPVKDARPVPTHAGDSILCLRPEACTMDRLAQVAAWGVAEAYLQAMAIAAAQGAEPGWDPAWIGWAAKEAGLSKQWAHLRLAMQDEQPQASRLEEALQIGWD